MLVLLGSTSSLVGGNVVVLRGGIALFPELDCCG